MNKYDEKVPQSLKNLQDWFASIITMPIDDDSQMNAISPFGTPMTNEAAKYITPSPTLTPEKRIQLYNQQYWWRLLATLHENFPTATSLLGYHNFNDWIAVPFLKDNPPDNWSLSLLGAKLPLWVQENYRKEDRLLILETISIDWAYVYSFYASQLPTLQITEDGDVSFTKLHLQPHLQLFTLHHNLLPFREKILQKNPEYWSTHDIPPLECKNKYSFVIYRNHEYNVGWLQIDNYEYSLLSQFTKGLTIEEACHWIETRDLETKKTATHNLKDWFQKWTTCGWLGIKNEKTK
ncbi:MAG: DNA-binding domain-containing protein [Chlamydiota bacterium]|nr:DNA-binding domain-containing protein [Chlamydiota bacterium]